MRVRRHAANHVGLQRPRRAARPAECVAATWPARMASSAAATSAEAKSGRSSRSSRQPRYKRTTVPIAPTRRCDGRSVRPLQLGGEHPRRPRTAPGTRPRAPPARFPRARWPTPAVAASKRSHNSGGPGTVHSRCELRRQRELSLDRARSPTQPALGGQLEGVGLLRRRLRQRSQPPWESRVRGRQRVRVERRLPALPGRHHPLDDLRDLNLPLVTLSGFVISDESRSRACSAGPGRRPPAVVDGLVARLFREHPVDLALADAPEPRAGAVRLQLAFLDPFAHRRLGHAKQPRDVRDAEQPVLALCHHLADRNRLTMSNHCYPTP